MTAWYVRKWSLPFAEMGHTPSRRRRPLLARPFVEKIIAGGVTILSPALKHMRRVLATIQPGAGEVRRRRLAFMITLQRPLPPAAAAQPLTAAPRAETAEP